MNKNSFDSAPLFLYFIIVALTGSLLLSLPAAYKAGVSCSYIDALFTSISAVCVTGLSTVSMDIFSRTGFVILLVLIELGGLGFLSFIALSIALPSKKVSMTNRKFIKTFFIDDVEYSSIRILRRIILLTLSIQLAGFLLLLPGLYYCGNENFIFDSLFLSVSAFCNAGFSTKADSLASYNSSCYVLSVVMLLIILGGLGFVVMDDIKLKIKSLFTGKKHYFSLHSKLVLILIPAFIFTGAAVSFFLCRNHAFSNLSTGQKLFQALFESVTLRTAGFETISQGNFTHAAGLFQIFLMFTGGAPGSIAGGVKITTIFITLMYAFNEDEGNNVATLYNRTIPSSTINKAITIVSRSFIFLSLSVFFMAMAEHESLSSGAFRTIDVIYESTSAFATVGLTRGITPLLTTAGKIIIMATMFIGRTGIFAMALKLGNPKENNSIITYPQETIMIG